MCAQGFIYLFIEYSQVGLTVYGVMSSGELQSHWPEDMAPCTFSLDWLAVVYYFYYSFLSHL